MNLKLAKKIRQGMREMAGIERPGLGPDFVHPGIGRAKHSIIGKYPDDYEGEIPSRGYSHLAAIYPGGYIHSKWRGLWSTENTNSEGTTETVPERLVIRLKLTSARQVYKRAKKMVQA